MHTRHYLVSRPANIDNHGLAPQSAYRNASIYALEIRPTRLLDGFPIPVRNQSRRNPVSLYVGRAAPRKDSTVNARVNRRETVHNGQYGGPCRFQPLPGALSP